MNINKRKPLTSLEYAGMESLLDRIINAYEEYQGIPEYDRLPQKKSAEGQRMEWKSLTVNITATGLRISW